MYNGQEFSIVKGIGKGLDYGQSNRETAAVDVCSSYDVYNAGHVHGVCNNNLSRVSWSLSRFCDSM